MSNRFEGLTKRGKSAILLGSALVCALVLGGVLEAGLRIRQSLTQSGATAHGVEDFYVLDQALGLRVPVAGFRSARLNINSLGFRGAEFSAAKPEGTIRIAFMGGSTTFCAEVSSDEAAWPQRAIRALREAYPEQRFEQVNAGVPGFMMGTIQRNLEIRVAPLRPDVIVIYEATNDLSMHVALTAERLGLPDLRGTGELSWLARNSLLYYLMTKNIQFMLRQSQADSTVNKLTIPSEELTPIFARDLVALVQAARKITDKVVLVTFSSQMRAGQNPAELAKAALTAVYYMPYRKPADLVRDFAAYNATIRAVAREQGAVLVEAGDHIPGYAAHFVDSVHFSDRGAAAMAAIVAAGLRDTGWFNR